MIIDRPAINTTAIVWTKTEVSGSELDNITSPTGFALRTIDEWPRQLSRIAKLKLLKDNWDGEGAIAPSRELLQSLAHLLRIHQENGYPAPSRIVPTVDGIIAIEWQMPPRFASLEIARPYEGEWLIEQPGYRPEFRVEKWSPPTVSASWSQIHALHL